MQENWSGDVLVKRRSVGAIGVQGALRTKPNLREIDASGNFPNCS